MSKKAPAVDPLASPADRLGYLNAQIAALTAQANEIKKTLKAQGPGDYPGQLFRVEVVVKHISRVDWKAVAAKLKPSRQLVKAHTKEADTSFVYVKEAEPDHTADLAQVNAWIEAQADDIGGAS